MSETRRGVLARGLAVVAASSTIGRPHLGFAQTAAATWLDPARLAAAKAEGAALVVYSSINEQEGLPAWQYFETAGGLNLPAAWDKSTGTGVVVGVVDTGYRNNAIMESLGMRGLQFHENQIENQLASETVELAHRK